MIYNLNFDLLKYLVMSNIKEVPEIFFTFHLSEFPFFLIQNH